MAVGRVAVVVYPGGLENLCPSGLTGSNPVPSACAKATADTVRPRRSRIVVHSEGLLTP